MARTSLAWFSNDLRLHDNPMLHMAHRAGEQVLHVYFKADAYHGLQPGSRVEPSPNRQSYLDLSLDALRERLWQQGQELMILEGSALEELPALIDKYQLQSIHRSRPLCANEISSWQKICDLYPALDKYLADSTTLYDLQNLPCAIEQLPKQFTPFRKLVEASSLSIEALGEDVPWAKPVQRPQMFRSRKNLLSTKIPIAESQALAYLKAYLKSPALRQYSSTRNALENGSSLLSASLALGSLSPRELFKQLGNARLNKANHESCYSLYLELMWREFFLWNALRLNKKLFLKGGERAKSLGTSFYPQRLRAWQTGSTEWPLVNAIMHELNESGYISNRSRQIAASCLINELQLDWRYGAVYFEAQLIDYDPAINWGNWQYIAGVGADPRGGRHFYIEKQAAQYDSDGHYVSKWRGNEQLTPTRDLDAYY